MISVRKKITQSFVAIVIFEFESRVAGRTALLAEDLQLELQTGSAEAVRARQHRALNQQLVAENASQLGGQG